MNRNCECKLIVGPVRVVKGRCRNICGGNGEVKVEGDSKSTSGRLVESDGRDRRGRKNEAVRGVCIGGLPTT